MAETVGCVLFITLTIAFFGVSADSSMDLIPAAITVYRNPEFFGNLTEKGEESEEDDEGRGNPYSNNSEEFYDFEDEYKYPGEPKKPNPPAAPDFFTYFDESPEFQPEPREISPPRGGNLEEEQYEEDNELNEYGGSTTPRDIENQEESEDEREMMDEDAGDRESTEQVENQEDEESEEEKEEVNEEDDYEERKEEPKKKDKYYVPMEKNLRMRVPQKVYEESKEYFNPVLNSGITAFHYPSTYEDLDYYSYEDEDRKKPYVDNKKGTREYLKDHSVEEVEYPGNMRADSKHIIRTVSKIGIRALKPVLYVPHVGRIKKKYKILHKPGHFYKWGHHHHHLREVPDDSVYQLSSDYDSDFEFF